MSLGVSGFRFHDLEADEPSAQNKWSANFYGFVRNTRTFPKTVAEIRDFSYAKLTGEDEDIVVVISLRAAPAPIVSRGGYGVANLLSQSIHRTSSPSVISAHWKNRLQHLPTNLTQQLEVVGARAEQHEGATKENDREVTVTTGLGLLLRDSWGAIREYTVSWMAIWGAVVQLVAWLIGGFDAEFKITTAIVILFLVTKALVHLRAGEFGLAFWRILHFPLWMTIIAIGTLGDLSHAQDATSLRKVAMLFVTTWCLGGSTTAVMTLLGLKRIEHLRRGFKRLIREVFAEDDDEG